MGLFDKLKDKSRGLLTAAKPDDGVDPRPSGEVRRRLLAISARRGCQRGLRDLLQDHVTDAGWTYKPKKV